MPISVLCGCGKRFDVPDSYRGRTGKCTACGAPLQVPADDMLASGEQLASFGGAAGGQDTVGTQMPVVKGAGASPTAAKVGQQVGEYLLSEKLGQEAGSVFLADSPQGAVALKVLPGEIVAKSPTAGKRFLREARSLFNLNHPSLIRILDAGEELGTYFLAMEYFEGQTIKQLIEAQKRLPESVVIEVALGVAGALACLHENNLVHRNIKPDHILVDGVGTTKLAGMGLVKTSEGDEPALTVKGAIVGTPQFMPPEQARGGDLDVRSDLYSLGMTMYTALTGEVPFQSKVIAMILRKLTTEPPPPVREKNPQASEAIAAVVAKLVEKDPDLRYQTPRELISDLEAIKQGNLVRGLPPIAAMPPAKKSGRQGKGDAQESGGGTETRVQQLTAIVVVLALVVVGLLVAVLSR